MYENNWQEEEMPISKIKQLLEDGYEIEVDSPDGFIPVNFFIDKGNWQEFILELDNGETVKCNENHLFETINGWKFAKELINENTQFLTKEGWVKGIVSKTDNIIPIVDINVEHDNHRYYTNGVSSHNTGVGKSLMMCFIAANAMMLGKNVMYITMEMSEEMISERIDANLMDLRIQDVESLKKSDYLQRINKLKSKTIGNLLVKEFPTASANSSHFRALLREARIKKKFEPDLLVIDYLNICASSRMKMANNSYNYVKAIAEELRGLAMEFNVPLLSATQATRDANGNSDMDLKDTSECIFVDEIVTLRNGLTKKIKDVEVGDQILSNDVYKTVMKVHHPKMKKCVKIKTKSGKTIIVSKDHVFPTKSGRVSVNSGGLKVGSMLSTK